MTPPAPLSDAALARRQRATLWRLLGVRPSRRRAVAARCAEASTAQGVRTERWLLDLATPTGQLEPPVPALLLRPAEGPLRGVVLYNHAHGGRFDRGKDELTDGRPALQAPAYGPALAARGWASLAIDHLGFGERQHLTERQWVKRALWQGATLWGWRVHDTLRAFDWLRAQPACADLPIVTLGLSMGSTMAYWAAALEPGIAGCIDLCCAAEYQSLLDSGGIDGHGEYYFVPGLLRRFTLADIGGLVAPRPYLSLAGRADPLTPPAGLAALDAALRQRYAALGAADHWQQVVEDGGHAETPTMRAAVLAWLDRIAPPPAA